MRHTVTISGKRIEVGYQCYVKKELLVHDRLDAGGFDKLETQGVENLHNRCQFQLIEN